MTIKVDWDRAFRTPAVVCTCCRRTLVAGSEPVSYGICNECLVATTARIADAIGQPMRLCARCHHVHYNDQQRARCSAREDQ